MFMLFRSVVEAFSALGGKVEDVALRRSFIGSKLPAACM